MVRRSATAHERPSSGEGKRRCGESSALVRAENDEQVIPEAFALQRPSNPADGLVDGGDHREAEKPRLVRHLLGVVQRRVIRRRLVRAMSVQPLSWSFFEDEKGNGCTYTF